MPQNKSAVGVAGCGRMGLPMAMAMSSAGLNVRGFDVRSVSEFGEFERHMSADPTVFAQHCDTVFTIVRDQRQTDALLFDEQALIDQPNGIKTLVICSTLSPRYLLTLRERIPRHISLIDAPMSGAVIAAEQARLSFMVGGDEKAIDVIEPVLLAMGNSIHRMGQFGTGMTAKVLNNFSAAASVTALRQILEWADQLGVDEEALRKLMHDSSGQTWFASNFDQIEFARDGYDEENTIGILKKDVESALDAVGADSTKGLQAAILDALTSMRPRQA